MALVVKNIDPRFNSTGNEQLTEIENLNINQKDSLGKSDYRLSSREVIDKINILYKKETSIISRDIGSHISLINPKNKIIIGPDDRIKVLETEFPYNCISLLIITDDYDRKYFGTGFFISERCVITAGHCVFFNGTWAKKIEVIPGAKGTAKPYGYSVSGRFRSVEGWTKNNNANFDYGAVILKDNKLFKNLNVYFGYSVINKRKLIELSGYPMDKNNTQWKSEGEIQRLSTYRLYYELDTVKGNSGSPVFIRKGKSRIVVGVHSFGQKPNYSIRLNQNILNRWSEWSNL